MGDISIIARRLPDGHVQYGWSGNGGYYRMVGARLLAWYQNPKDVDYLFHLGQTRLIGKIGSEYGGYKQYETHWLTREPFWIDNTEQLIFSTIAFVDFGYFYDQDNKWYYIVPRLFRIKMPLELIANNIDETGFEYDFLQSLSKKIVDYILHEYPQKDPEFAKLLSDNNYDPEEIKKNLDYRYDPLDELCSKYEDLHTYFDNWILVKVKADSDYKNATEIVMKKKTENHIETNLW